MEHQNRFHWATCRRPTHAIRVSGGLKRTIGGYIEHRSVALTPYRVLARAYMHHDHPYTVMNQGHVPPEGTAEALYGSEPGPYTVT